MFKSKTEKWKAVNWHYAISTKKRVARLTPSNGTWPGRILKHPETSSNGLITAYLEGDGTRSYDHIEHWWFTAMCVDTGWTTLAKCVKQRLKDLEEIYGSF